MWITRCELWVSFVSSVSDLIKIRHWADKRHLMVHTVKKLWHVSYEYLGENSPCYYETKSYFSSLLRWAANLWWDCLEPCVCISENRRHRWHVLLSYINQSHLRLTSRLAAESVESTTVDGNMGLSDYGGSEISHDLFMWHFSNLVNAAIYYHLIISKFI